jgi:methylthioribose-1-phosphate isomerase
LKPIPTLEWTGDSLRLLDQRLLPDLETYLICKDVPSLAEAIRTLAVRGAPAIGIAAAFGAALAAMTTAEGPGFTDGVRGKLSLLASTRPTAVNLFHCLDLQAEVLAGHTGRRSAIEALLANAFRLMEEDLEASRKMGRLGADLLPDAASILTHCNAGGLATAGLGTALAVIYEGWERGIVRRVFADETRPLLQGARLTAWELSRAGIPVQVLPDSAAASLLRSGAVDAVIVGADRIAANGDAANKVGTYPLALAARAHGVPFYVVAPLSTFDLDTPCGDRIVIEQRDRAEISTFGGRNLIPEAAGFWNPAFDVTPAGLVTAIICEAGTAAPPDSESVERLTH